MANPLYGKLCHDGSGSLCYSKTGQALIYKADMSSDIEVIISSTQSSVGPIKSCGNIHNVKISASGGDATVVSTGAGLVRLRITVTTKPASYTISCTTESDGCAYPEENPPMGISVVAIQVGTGQTKNASKSVSNVATGSFSATITVDANGKLTGVS